MRVFEIAKPNHFKEFLNKLNLDRGGVEIISNKMELIYIYIKDLKTPAINILKQDALSVGAEVAAPSGVITCAKEKFDCLLIATKRELEALVKKEKAQPFGLKEVANEIEKIISAKSYPLKIMGIINANSDSFYSGSRFRGEEAIKEIKKQIKDGANIIDIGAVSSRPGSKPVSKEEEINRVKDILQTIKKEKLYEIVDFSIDSYTPEVVKMALDSGFKYINDIFGARDEELIKLAIKYNSKYIIMHMKGTPQTMQNNPYYECVVAEVEDFFKEQISKCENLGLKRENIILDVGIGFGKRLEDNLKLLKAHKNFLKFGCELLIGASRKSLINNIIPTKIEERLPGTLAIHIKAVERGASIVRCHDVREHKIAFEVLKHL